MSNEQTPFLEKHEALPDGKEYQIPAHTERQPTPAELASEQAHLVEAGRQARSEVAITASESNPVEQFQAAQAAAQDDTPQIITAETKNHARNQQLKQVRRKLPVAERTLSKVVHQKVVNAVSETAGKTISRPSGLLGGGLMAFIGSAAYLYFTRYIGVQYNYLIFVLLFVVGFAFGLVLEFIVWSLTHNRRHSD